MASFFFPMLRWVPAFEEDVVGTGTLRVHRRKWQVAIFDLYSLVAQRHPVRIPAELMHIFLETVNLEVEVSASDFAHATELLDCFRAMTYLRGTSPTIAPFGCNTSLNAYAGINGRSSGHQATMHEGLREGITHNTARVETWPHELSFSCVRGPDADVLFELGSGVIAGAANDTERWLSLEKRYPVVRAARHAFVKAPLMPDIASSILHIWQGIESLFPSISTEITFRTSLLLAELSEPLHVRSATYEAAKKSYGDRSKISHGIKTDADLTQWLRAWQLLSNALQAILIRDELPTEEELTRQLLNRE